MLEAICEWSGKLPQISWTPDQYNVSEFGKVSQGVWVKKGNQVQYFCQAKNQKLLTGLVQCNQNDNYLAGKAF